MKNSLRKGAAPSFTSTPYLGPKMREESTKQTTSLTDTKGSPEHRQKDRAGSSIHPARKEKPFAQKQSSKTGPCTVNSHGQPLQQTHFQAPVLMAQGSGELSSLRTSWNLSQDSWLQEPLGE